MGIRTNANSSGTLTMLHVGGINGILSNA